MATSETGGLLKRRALAAAFDVDVQTILKWERAGLPVTRGTPGRPSVYRLTECVKWFVEREVRARGGNGSSSLNPLEQRALLDRTRREEIELRLAVRRAELIEAADVDRAWAAIVLAVRERILGLASTALQQGVVAPDQEAALDRLLRDALVELATQRDQGAA